MSRVLKPTYKLTAKSFLKNYVRYDMNHVVQRRDVWKPAERSLFIHSLIMGYPIPPFFALDEKNIDDTKKDVLYMLDGKQRLTTILLYCTDQFPLTQDTPAVPMMLKDAEGNEYESEVEIAGLKYSELPPEIQDEIRDTELNFIKLQNATEEDVQEIFFRLNSGVSLNQIEKTRALATTKVMDFVNSIAVKPFFSSSMVMPLSQKNRFVDEEVVLQIMMLLMNEGVKKGFSGKEIREFALTLKEKGIPEDIKATLEETADYLFEALPDPFKFLKKVNVPIIFIHAVRALKEGIPAKKFGGWVLQFSGTVVSGHGKYGQTLVGGTAKREKIEKRLEAMSEDYEKNIQNAPDYVKPEPAQAGGRQSGADKANNDDIPPQNEDNAPSNEDGQEMTAK